MKQKFTIDLKNASDPAEIHDILANALPFPDYYGRNLDALYDVLTEFGSNWRITLKNAANIGDSFRSVFADAIADTPGLEIRGL